MKPARQCCLTVSNKYTLKQQINIMHLNTCNLSPRTRIHSIWYKYRTVCENVGNMKAVPYVLPVRKLLHRIIKTVCIAQVANYSRKWQRCFGVTVEAYSQKDLQNQRTLSCMWGLLTCTRYLPPQTLDYICAGVHHMYIRDETLISQAQHPQPTNSLCRRSLSYKVHRNLEKWPKLNRCKTVLINLSGSGTTLWVKNMPLWNIG